MNRIDWIKQRIIVNENHCWEWQGWKDRDGYGRTKTSDNGVLVYRIVHRWMWELHNGAIPKGKMICHHCDNPACVNMEHLYLGNALTNRQDCFRRGRANINSGEKQWCHQKLEQVVHGEKRAFAKLTVDSVQAIRKRKQERSCSTRQLIAELAREYHVCKGTISKVIWSKTWIHVA